MEELCNALRLTVSALEEAQSGYIPGSGPDLRWDKQKDHALQEACAALLKHEQQ